MFETVRDPVHDGYEQILDTIIPLKSHLEKLVLGSAQFGNAYGISSSGLVDPKTALGILETASELGIKTLDTAHAYGESESIIGSYLGVKGAGKFFLMTKLDPSISEDVSDDLMERSIRASVFESLFKLKIDKIDIVMFHRPFQISRASLRALKQLREKGYIGKIGVSINTPDELHEVLEWKEIEHIQLPLNILDHRWRKREIVTLLEKFSAEGKTIHARSAFLQGLMFLKDASKWPRLPVSYDPEGVINIIQSLEEKKGKSISELSLKYLLSLSWISGIVIGVENSEQLKEAGRRFQKASLISDLTSAEISMFDSLPEELLVPSKWIKNEI